MRRAVLVVAVLAVAGASGVACRGQTSQDPPIVPIRNMHIQPRYSYQARGAFFQDDRVMRTPPVGTIAQEMEIDQTVAIGMDDAGNWTPMIPEAVVARKGGMEAMLVRGRDRYNIYCVPCHDGTGSGRGMVVRRSDNAAFAPPTFHDDRIRHIPDGQLFATISNGIRNMPAYYAQIPVDDRWAIVAYVRALQLSQVQHARANAPAAPARQEAPR
jgi:mono/diheme cytochrome c family protein